MTQAAPKTYEIVLLPGDGVGPEVTRAARDVLAVIGDFYGHNFNFTEHLIGGAAIDETGEPLPEATRAACVAADAVLLGAVGGPKWDGGKRRPEEGLLAIRKAMGLFANLRPLQVSPVLAHRSPLKKEIVEGVDLIVFRELTGGVYFGEKTRTADRATDLCEYTVPEIERVARAAFQTARQRRGKVTSVDKANVMETSRLWREVVTRIHAEEFPEIVADAAHAILTRPAAECTGNFFIDEEVLRAEGVTDFSAYAPGATGSLAADFFVPDEVLARTGTKLAGTFS